MKFKKAHLKTKTERSKLNTIKEDLEDEVI